MSLHVSPGSRHHRQGRRLGDHGAANLVLLCGSGTTGCHGWAHANPRAARELGLIVSAYADAVATPIYLEHLRQWAHLETNGDRIMITPEQATKSLIALGVIS